MYLPTCIQILFSLTYIYFRTSRTALITWHHNIPCADLSRRKAKKKTGANGYRCVASIRIKRLVHYGYFSILPAVERVRTTQSHEPNKISLMQSLVLDSPSRRILLGIFLLK